LLCYLSLFDMQKHLAALLLALREAFALLVSGLAV
jgi:hypothetical protein